jgi:endo-1,4-beta-xylanase
MKKLLALLKKWFGIKHAVPVKPPVVIPVPVPDSVVTPDPIKVKPPIVLPPQDPDPVIDPIPVFTVPVESAPVIIPDPKPEPIIVPLPVPTPEPLPPAASIPVIVPPVVVEAPLPSQPVVKPVPVIIPIKPAPPTKTLLDSPITWGVAFKEADLDNTKVIAETYRQFRSMTPENGIKHGKLQAKQGVFDFTNPRALVKIAKAKGLRVHGHVCFVWPTQESGLPAFWAEAAKNKDTYIALLKNTVQTIVKEFKNDIFSWDIINEAHENNGDLRPCAALTHMGVSYPEQIAKWVKEVQPTAKCFISDFDYQTASWKTTVVIKYAGELKKKGLIDGLSSQMHVGLNFEYKTFKKRLDEMAAQNLLVHLSEIDFKDCLPSDEPLKAELFKQIATGFRTLPVALQYGCTTWSHTAGGNYYNHKVKPQKWAPVIFDNDFNGGLTLPAILEVK